MPRPRRSKGAESLLHRVIEAARSSPSPTVNYSIVKWPSAYNWGSPKLPTKLTAHGSRASVPGAERYGAILRIEQFIQSGEADVHSPGLLKEKWVFRSRSAFATYLASDRVR